jgi:hypothetical protein
LPDVNIAQLGTFVACSLICKRLICGTCWLQVCYNCMTDPEAVGELEQQAQQAAAAASAEQALAAAFAGLLCDESKLLQQAPAELGGLTVLYEVCLCRLCYILSVC